MVPSLSRIAAALALAGLAAPTAAMAAALPASRGGAYLPPMMRTAPAWPAAHEHPGGWGGGGWGGGWHHHDDGISGGDVLAGLLVLGGIAAVAVAASNANKHQHADRSDYPDSRYIPPVRDSAPPANAGPGSIDAAVDTCVAEVERGRSPVDSVDSVNNAGNGWHVEGHLRGGKAFACRVDSSGRIGSLTIDGAAPGY